MRLAFALACVAFVATTMVVAVGEGNEEHAGQPMASTERQRVGFDGGLICTVASITDGDTLRCAETGSDGKQIRIRLSGVAARERDGTCSAGHPCPEGSAEAATAELERLATGEVLICREVGRTYGRVAAFCLRRSDGLDLSCAMVASGTAARWDRHWGGHRCP
jgi:endonuclease YncB( thermonuclease family)